MTAASKRLQTEAVNLVRRMVAARQREDAAGEAPEESELVYEPGAGWWQGDRQVAARIPLYLMRRGLIRADEIGGGLEHWEFTAEAAAFVAHPDAPTPLEVAMVQDAARERRLTAHHGRDLMAALGCIEVSAREAIAPDPWRARFLEIASVAREALRKAGL